MPLAGQSFETNVGNSYDAARSRKEFNEFVAAENAKEQAKLERSVKSLTVLPTEASHAMRVHNFEMTEAWSAPLTEIQAILDSKKWTSLYWLIHLREDTEPRIRQTEREAFNVFQAYCAALTQRTGFKLNPDGVERLSKLVCVELRCGKIEVTEATIDAALDCLLRNHVFADGEVEYDANWKTAPAQQAANATVVDFEALNLTGSEEDKRRGKAAVEFLAETAAAPTAKAWLDSLAKNFGFVPTKADLDYSIKWFRENNRSWFTPASYDAFRLHMVHSGRWSTALLSESDIRACAIERLNTNDRDIRGIVFHGSKEALLDLLARRGVSLT